MTDHRSCRSGIAVLSIFCCSLIWPNASAAQFKAYIWVFGVSGESVDKEHQGWSDVISFADETNIVDPCIGGSNFCDPHPNQEVRVTKRIDAASSPLRAELATGKPIREVILDVESATVRLRTRLENVVILSVTSGGTGVDFPTEQLVLGLTGCAEYLEYKFDEKGNPVLTNEVRIEYRGCDR